MYAERRSISIPATVWCTRSRPGTSTIAPDGCMDIIWDGDGFLVAGPDARPYAFTAELPRTLTAVRFDPGVAPRVLGLPAVELRDQRVDLSQLWPRHDVERWAEAMRADDDPTRTLERLATQRYRAAGATDGWARGVADLAAAGVPVGEVARRSGLSERQQHRRAAEAFGYGLRTLQRVLRVQRAQECLLAGGTPARVAGEVGYADQAHLTRECRALLGVTPSRLRRGV